MALADCGSEREGKWLLTWHEDIRPISHGKKENELKLFFRVSIFFGFLVFVENLNKSYYLFAQNLTQEKAQDARKECWDGTGLNANIGFWECHTQGGNQLFKYIPDKHQIFHVPSQGCATADKVIF